MVNSLAIALMFHVVFAVIWVGGMFFAYIALRPAAAQLQPPQRLQLWVNTFKKFFLWVWKSIFFLFISGFWMIGNAGGMANVGKHVHIMYTLAFLMVLLFCFLFFMPYKKLKASVALEDWENADIHLATIRRLIAVNLSLGLLVVIVATLGKAW